jgi:hypothetical protein
MSYNGWKNWETWNVALWINNDEGLYNMALEFSSYKAFRESLRELETEGCDVTLRHSGGGGTYKSPSIAYETPDGVAWNDSALDVDRLDEMLKENRDEEAEESAQAVPAHGGTGGAPD